MLVDLVCKAKLLNDFLFFTRYFFKAQYGRKFIVAGHHVRIAEALTKVVRGETKRLIINMPPRYGKCSPRGTMVMTPFGPRDISMLNAGDTVFSHDSGRLVRRNIKATETFHKECVTIRSKSGRDLRVSADHPVLTQRGWIQAHCLTSEHYLIRVCAEVDGPDRLPDAELDFLTLMLFEGGCSGKSMIRFTSSDSDVVDVLRQCTMQLGIGLKQYPSHAAIDYHIMGGASGEAGRLLIKHGMMGCLAKNKRLPVAFFNLPLDQKYRFLSLMFATDGFVTKGHGQLGVALASEPFIDDIALLLDTCGVPCRKYVKKNQHAGAWELCIGASHINRLAGKVNLLQKQPDFLAALEHPSRESTIFGYPYDAAKGQTYRCKQAIPKIDFKHAGVMISDAKLDRMIEEIDADLAKWKMDDFIYDRVASVTPSGKDDVFHLEIDAQDYDAKNYIASGYVVHNTEVAVKMFVAWCMANNPGAKFIHLSYSDDLALDNSSAIRDVVKSPEFQRFFPVALRADSDSKKKWWLEHGGGLYATSTGGPITGFGAGGMGRVRSGTGSPADAFSGALIIDDAIKPDDAFSDTMRDRINRRFNNTFMSRLNSQDTPIIVIMQRLHENDMTGYLLGGGSGEKWEHLCLTAITDDGESLWPEKLDIATLRQMEAADPYTFAGQYMQSPSPLTGGILKPDNISVIEALPAGPIEWVRGWDFASTTTGDWTAGAKLGKLPDGRIIIGDMVRIRVGPDERDAALVNATARDGYNCKASIPQDPGQAGLTQVKYLLRQLSGYSVKATPESGNKVVRCEPFASQVNVGNVMMLKADWNTALISEMRMFPNGTWDDQVDACSRAFAALIGRNPTEIFIPDMSIKETIAAAGTCGRCSAYENGMCNENFGLQVGFDDPGCPMFIAIGS